MLEKDFICVKVKPKLGKNGKIAQIWLDFDSNKILLKQGKNNLDPSFLHHFDHYLLKIKNSRRKMGVTGKMQAGKNFL